jgi:phosphoglycerate dehydrogenase-like enzyme
MTQRLLILSAKAESYHALIKQAGLPGLEMVIAKTPAEARAAGRDCTIVLGEPKAVAQVLDDLPKLQWVQSTWAGVEPLVQPGLRRDYRLSNVRGIFGVPIAEYVIGYALMHARLGWQRYRSQQQQRWDQTPPAGLRGHCMAILGVGSIGSEVARYAKFFGMTTRGYSRSGSPHPAIDHGYGGDQLLACVRNADYVVCTLPNTHATHGLINGEILAAMPRHALLLSVGRGQVIDEAALLAALQHERIGGAVLDVLATEPLPSEHPLWRLPNVIITAHTAALTSLAEMAPIFFENYRRFVKGEPLQYLVEFERGY